MMQGSPKKRGERGWGVERSEGELRKIDFPHFVKYVNTITGKRKKDGKVGRGRRRKGLWVKSYPSLRTHLARHGFGAHASKAILWLQAERLRRKNHFEKKERMKKRAGGGRRGLTMVMSWKEIRHFQARRWERIKAGGGLREASASW